MAAPAPVTPPQGQPDVVTGAQLQQFANHVQAQLAALQQQPPVQPQHAARPKPPPMVLFGGRIGVNGFAVDAWLRECGKQFAHFTVTLASDAAKIRFAVEWLTEDALTWWESEDRSAIQTWDQFGALMRDRYRPQLAEEVARQKLRALKQTGRVSAYCDEYLKLVARIPGRAEADKVFDFKQGLFASLAAKVAEAKPKTLHEAMECAVAAEPYVSGRNGASATYRPFASGSYRGGDRAASSSSAPMDLNAVAGDEAEAQDEPPTPSNETSVMHAMLEKIASLEQRLMAMHQGAAGGASRSAAAVPNFKGKSGRVAGRTVDDIREMQAKQQCFRCGKKGHFKRECPLNA